MSSSERSELFCITHSIDHDIDTLKSLIHPKAEYKYRSNPNHFGYCDAIIKHLSQSIDISYTFNIHQTPCWSRIYQEFQAFEALPRAWHPNISPGQPQEVFRQVLGLTSKWRRQILLSGWMKFSRRMISPARLSLVLVPTETTWVLNLEISQCANQYYFSVKNLTFFNYLILNAAWKTICPSLCQGSRKDHDGPGARYGVCGNCKLISTSWNSCWQKYGERLIFLLFRCDPCIGWRTRICRSCFEICLRRRLYSHSRKSCPGNSSLVGNWWTSCVWWADEKAWTQAHLCS